MKNVFRFSLLVVLLSMSVRVAAADELDVKVANNQTLVVELDNVREGTVLVFKDTNGEVLFRDSLLKGTYRKSLSLEVVPNGVYYLSLDSENNILTNVVTKSDKGIFLTGKTPSIAFKPSYKIVEKKLQVFLTNPEKKSAKIKVLDSKGIVVGVLNEEDFIVNKTLDFSRVPSGDYTIEISLGDNQFTRAITI